LELVLLSQFCHSLSEDLNAKPFNVCKAQYLVTLKIRKMRKLLLVLSLLVVFLIGTGMKTLEAQNCWLEHTITWSGNCVYPDDNTAYYANFTIIDVCDNNNPVFSQTKEVATTENPLQAVFCVEDALCKIDEVSLCFKVICTVQKRNKITNAIVCSGQTILPTKNCAGLLQLDGLSTDVQLN
jgi:hypothetical protein